MLPSDPVNKARQLLRQLPSCFSMACFLTLQLSRNLFGDRLIDMNDNTHDQGSALQTPLPRAIAAITVATIRRNGRYKDSVAKGSPQAERTKAMRLGTFADLCRLCGCTSGLLGESKPAI